MVRDGRGISDEAPPGRVPVPFFRAPGSWRSASSLAPQTWSKSAQTEVKLCVLAL